MFGAGPSAGQTLYKAALACQVVNLPWGSSPVKSAGGRWGCSSLRFYPGCKLERAAVGSHLQESSARKRNPLLLGENQGLVVLAAAWCCLVQLWWKYSLWVLVAAPMWCWMCFWWPHSAEVASLQSTYSHLLYLVCFSCHQRAQRNMRVRFNSGKCLK